MTSAELQPVRSRPKLDETYARLGIMAATLEPGTRLPKVTDLCRELDVSVVTLGKALARLEAEGVLSRKHGLGIFTNQQHKHAIHLICDPALFRAPDTSPLWSILLDHLKARAEAADESLSLHFAGFAAGSGIQLSRGLMQDIREKRMDGVLLVGLNDETTRWILEQGVHAVGYAAKANFRVRNDNGGMISKGVELLAKSGCQRIGFWNGITSGRVEDVILTREEGYKAPLMESLRRHDRQYIPELVESGLDFVDNSTEAVEISVREQGFRLANRVFSRPRSEWPQGLVIVNDIATLGALVAMSRMGIRPGRDVLIASHANVGSSALQGYEDDLAIIPFDPSKIVQAMFGLMETLLSGEIPANPMVYVGPEEPLAGSTWCCPDQVLN